MPWIRLVDPISKALNGNPAGHFFLYGLLYCLAVGLMGIRMLIKYRHSTYHKLRTGSLIFFQLIFAFLLPECLVRMNKPYFDFKNIWPLDYDFFFETELSKLYRRGKSGNIYAGLGYKSHCCGGTCTYLLLRKKMVLFLGLRLRRIGRNTR